MRFYGEKMENTDNSMINIPFLLRPAGKDYLWGGNRLNTDFHKEINMSPLAETWECSVHPDGESVVSGGRFDGMTLADVLRIHPEFMGEGYMNSGEFPLLIKFIDARQDLSVQVHPDDEYARIREKNQRGKTEMWYIVDADEGASIVYGLTSAIDAETFRKSVENGTLEMYLNRVRVKKGDSFLIEPGTVHAIGGGILIAEIQENSNLTYRIYDYNRVDKNGKKRELHIAKALDVARLEPAFAANKIPAEISGADREAALCRDNNMSEHENSAGYPGKEICSCGYFSVRRICADEDLQAEIPADSDTFRVILCTEGSGRIISGESSLDFRRGDCIFIPACNRKTEICGKSEILIVTGIYQNFV